jgi:hypothetical protein
MDTPRKRTIRIGNVTVGLVGLDVALLQVLQQGDMDDETAAAYLFAAISKENYLSAGTEELYRQALLQEYKRYRNPTVDNDNLTIRILGRPCVTCNKLKTMVIDILQKIGVAADIEDVHDLDEIWRYGVTQTPALIINNQVKSAGTQPPRFQVEQWLREAAAKQDSLDNNKDPQHP